MLPGSNDPSLRILGLILAGGLGRRLGGVNKAFEMVAGRTCLDRALSRLGPQVAALAINTNDDDPRWLDTGCALVPDADPAARHGPLAGLIAGLRHAAAHGFDAIASQPVDMPFAPHDFVRHLAGALSEENASFALAACEDQLCPVAGMWPVATLPILESAFEAGLRAPRALAHLMPMAVARWPAVPYDPFSSLNRPDDRGRLEEIARIAV